MLSLRDAITVTQAYHQKKSQMHKRTPPCHYCGLPYTGVTVDHIVPKAMGGPNTVWNKVDACRGCNNKKADKWPTCECWRCANARKNFKALKKAGLIVLKKKGKKVPVPSEGLQSHKRDACSGQLVDESATIVP